MFQNELIIWPICVEMTKVLLRYLTEYNVLEKISPNAKTSKHSEKKHWNLLFKYGDFVLFCLHVVTLVFFPFKKCRWTIWHWIFFSIALMRNFANTFILWHTCKEKTHYMERMVACLYVNSFITSWSLHDLWGPSLCCQCGAYWLDAKDSGFKCH